MDFDSREKKEGGREGREACRGDSCRDTWGNGWEGSEMQGIFPRVSQEERETK